MPLDLTDYWKNLPDTSTPLEAGVLNPWGEAVQEWAEDAQEAAEAAVAPTDTTVASLIADTGSDTREALDVVIEAAAASDGDIAALVADPDSETGSALRDGFMLTGENTTGSLLWVYGHSYALGGNDSTLLASYVNRLSTQGRFGTTTNRAISGTAATRTAFAALTGYGVDGVTPGPTKLWTPGSKGVVLIDAIVNCVQLWGDVPKGYAAANNAIRLLVDLARSSSKVEQDSGTNTYSGTWTDQSVVFVSGGTDKYTTTTAYVERTFTGDSTTLVFLGKDSLAGGTAPASIQIMVDGVTQFTVNTADQALIHTPGGDYGSNVGYGPLPIRVKGFGSGSHTIRATRTGTGIIYYDCALIPAAEPPAVILVKDTHRPSWATSTALGASNATLDLYNDLLDVIAADYTDGRVVVVDPNDGWDVATMSTTTDGKHPNDRGMAHFARVIAAALAELGWSPGWNIL